MDIKQANISATDTSFRTSGCGSVCIQVVPTDLRVHKLATRSTCMDVNKLDAPKSISLPTFCSYGESVSQRNEGKVYVDDNNTSLAFPTMEHPVIENVYTRSNFNSHISKSFDPLCQNQTLVLAAWKVSGNSILQKVYQTKNN